MSERLPVMLAEIVFFFRPEAICLMRPALGEPLVEADIDFEESDEFLLGVDEEVESDESLKLSDVIELLPEEEREFRAIAQAHPQDVLWLHAKMKELLFEASVKQRR